MMKAKLYTLCTAALLLAACTNDPMEDIVSPGTETPGLTDVPEGSYVIDYTPATDAPGTRADGDGPIQSLDYLLYASTDGTEGSYTLTKRRPIPDISLSTTWPLTRERMTWAQRQALKDTLETGKFYKAVFVANAADWLWDNDASTGAPTANEDLPTTSDKVLKNANLDGSTTAPKFNDARLLLPTAEQGSFNESNMYYLWTGDIKPTESHYDKNHPAQMSIVLQRMINKVEIRLEEEVVNALAEATSVTDYVEKQLGIYYDTYYVKKDAEGNIIEDDHNGELDKVIETYMGNIADKIDEEINDALYMGNNEKSSKNAFSDLMDNPESQKKVVSSINENVRTLFIETMEEDWQKYCDWSAVTNVIVNYDTDAFPYAIDFNKKTFAGESEATLRAEKVINQDNQYDNHYVFYIFSNNQATSSTSTTLNQISSLTFNQENSEYFETTCYIVPGPENSQKEGNHHFYITFQTLNDIKSSTNEKFNFQQINYDLEDVLLWDLENGDKWHYVTLGWSKNKMYKWINGLFSGDDNENDFTPYTLSLDIPKIETVWTTQDATAIDTQVLSEPVEP